MNGNERKKKETYKGLLVLVAVNIFIFFVAFSVYPKQYVGWETSLISAVVILMVLMILGVDLLVIGLSFLRLTGYKSKGKIEEERREKKLVEDKEKGATCSKCAYLDNSYCSYRQQQIEYPNNNYCIWFKWK